MKRTIIIDTDENRVDLLQEGYNIIEKSFYGNSYDDETVVNLAKKLLLNMK